MKAHTLFLTTCLMFLFLLLSCKSHKDVSRSVVAQTRGESLATVNDSLRTHLETSLTQEKKTKEETSNYIKQTDFDTEGKITKVTETFNLINLQVDFKSQLDQLKREDFKYNSATQTTDTASTIVQEKEKETKDSRPIQGAEWAIIILTVVGIVIGLYMFYFNRRR